MAQLLNRADVVGAYGDISVNDFSELTVELSTIKIEKSANKTIWIDDELEYSLVVTNIDDSLPGQPVNNVVVTDKIDPKIATLSPNSVTIDGSSVSPPEYTYDPDTGILTVPFDSMDVGTDHTITFRIMRVQP